MEKNIKIIKTKEWANNYSCARHIIVTYIHIPMKISQMHTDLWSVQDFLEKIINGV